MHAQREWGKYPATDLIENVMKRFKHSDRSKIKVLDLGCGAGANLRFFVEEGFDVYGIDGSPSAIKLAKKRMEYLDRSYPLENIEVGDFSKLSYESNYFDLVVDYFSIYANTCENILRTRKEVERVLKSGGSFFSRCWAVGCDGFDSGDMLELNTSKNPNCGPCKNMGVSHFFSEDEIFSYFNRFSSSDIVLIRKDNANQGSLVLEWSAWAEK
jgi:ubiquinone/menaquinone biosynthesis C-methylase UbiE